jgi:hypothetical protein
MDALEVHGMTLQGVVARDAAGRRTRRLRLTFKLGEQGPFIAEYEQADWTASRVKADVERRQQQLRALLGGNAAAG